MGKKNVRDRYPQVAYLLLGYLNEDWTCFYQDLNDCIKSFVEEEEGMPISTFEALNTELSQLISEFHSEKEWVDLLLYGFGCAYYYEAYSLTAPEFLAKIQGYLKKYVKEVRGVDLE